jgi:hypothetical protein
VSAAQRIERSEFKHDRLLKRFVMGRNAKAMKRDRRL